MAIPEDVGSPVLGVAASAKGSGVEDAAVEGPPGSGVGVSSSGAPASGERKLHACDGGMGGDGGAGGGGGIMAAEGSPELGVGTGVCGAPAIGGGVAGRAIGVECGVVGRCTLVPLPGVRVWLSKGSGFKVTPLTPRNCWMNSLQVG
jgi:hypothetical protein